MTAPLSKLLSLLMLLLIFGSGAVAGVAFDRVVVQRKAPAGSRIDRLVGRFARRLSLDAKQQDAVRAVLLKSRAATAAARKRIEPELRVARQQARKEIAAQLDPEQRKKFQEMTARYDARRARRKATGAQAH